MYRLRIFSIIASIVHIAIAADAQAAPHTITSSPQHATSDNPPLMRRADPTVTLTLGPASDHTATASKTPSIRSNDAFTIVPAGAAASDGADMFLAPSLQTSISKTYQDRCQNQSPTSQDRTKCLKALRDLFPANQLTAQKRQFGLLALVALGVLEVATLIGFQKKLEEHTNNIETLHLPASYLDQLKKENPPSAIAGITSPGATPVILPVRPNETPDPA
ncbi:MAG: hypothetical protein Q9160_009230, partial [Pyrenula sp. 1 TL-2023]